MKTSNKKFFLEKYYRQLNLIKEKVTNKSEGYSYKEHGSFGHYFYLQDIRTQLFYLEGVSRIDRKIGKDKDVFEELLLSFKKMEDAIGVYDYWYVFMKKAIELDFGQVAIQHLQENTFKSLGAMEYVMKTEGWVIPDEKKGFHSPKAEQVIEIIDKIDWYKNDGKENSKLLCLLRDEAIKADEQLATGKLDLSLIEAGIHELRRKMRWFPIYRIALLGRIQFSKIKTGSPLSHYVTPAELANPFNKQVECPKGIEPITIHTGAYMGMSVLIRQIGEIKDKALFTELAENICQATGLTASEIETKIKGYSIAHKEVVENASALIHKFVHVEKGLKYLADHFDKQIK